MPVAHDLARVVDVVDEWFSARMRCARPRLMSRHSAAGMIRGTRSSGKRPVARAVLAGQLERDALLQEDRVASPARLGQPSGPSAASAATSSAAYGATAPSGREDLVEEAVARGVAGAVGDRGLGGHRRPSFQRRGGRASPTGPTRRADVSKPQLPRGPNRTISESSTRSEPSGSEVTQTR